MKIFIKVNPSSKRTKLEEKEPPVGINSRYFLVSVQSPPQDGRANDELIEALSNHFNVSEGRVHIISGHRSPHKVVEVDL